MAEAKIKDQRRTIIRSLAVWLLIIVAEIVHITFRRTIRQVSNHHHIAAVNAVSTEG